MTKHLKNIAFTFIVTGVLCCGLLAFPSQAEACCIYNHTTYPLFVEGSRIRWTIAPSNKDCTNGTGGTVRLFLLDPFRSDTITHQVYMEVDDHGWISVYKKSGGKWKVVNKRKDGSVKDVKYLKPGNDHLNPEG